MWSSMSPMPTAVTDVPPSPHTVLGGADWSEIKSCRSGEMWTLAPVLSQKGQYVDGSFIWQAVRAEGSTDVGGIVVSSSSSTASQLVYSISSISAVPVDFSLWFSPLSGEIPFNCVHCFICTLVFPSVSLCDCMISTAFESCPYTNIAQFLDNLYLFV